MLALQAGGLLGTSHLLDVLARLVPGHAASRLALEPAIRVGSGITANEVGVGSAGAIGLTAAFAIVVAIVVAIVEEILFRGLLFEGVRRRLGLRAAVLGSALVFGLAHLDLHQGVAAAVLGVQLGALRAILGLPTAIFAHALNNAAAVLAWAGGLEPSATSLALAALLSITALQVLTRRAQTLGSVLQRASGSDEPSGGNGKPWVWASTGDARASVRVHSRRDSPPRQRDAMPRGDPTRRSSR